MSIFSIPAAFWSPARKRQTGRKIGTQSHGSALCGLPGCRKLVAVAFKVLRGTGCVLSWFTTTTSHVTPHSMRCGDTTASFGEPTKPPSAKPRSQQPIHRIPPSSIPPSVAIRVPPRLAVAHPAVLRWLVVNDSVSTSTPRTPVRIPDRSDHDLLATTRGSQGQVSSA